MVCYIFRGAQPFCKGVVPMGWERLIALGTHQICDVYCVYGIYVVPIQGGHWIQIIVVHIGAKMVLHEFSETWFAIFSQGPSPFARV